MSETVEIIVDQKLMGEALQKAKANVEELAKTVERANVKMKTSPEEAAAALHNIRLYESLQGSVRSVNKEVGLGREQFMRYGTVASQGMMLATMGTGELGSAIGSVTMKVTTLASAFAFGNVLGAGVAALSIGVGLLVAELGKAGEEAKKLVKPFQDVRAEIAALTELKGLAGMAQMLNVSEAALKTWLTTGKSASDVASTLSKSHELITVKAAALTRAMEELKQVERDSTFTSPGEAEVLRGKLADLRTEIGILSTAYQEAFGTVRRGTRDTAEQNRLLDLQKATVPQLASEYRSFQSSLRDMSVTHSDTMRRLAKDLTKTEQRASTDRLRIENETNERVVDLRSGLTTRINDIQRSHLRNLAQMDTDYYDRAEEAAYQHARTIERMKRDQRKAEQDTKKELERLNRDTSERIGEINEKEAHDLEDVDRQYWGREAELKKEIIRADADAERKRVRREAEGRKGEIAERAAERRAELAERRKELEDEYNHSRELADRDLGKAKERAREQTREQIDQAKRATEEQIRQAELNSQKQIKAVQDRLAEEKKSIGEREQEEIGSYGKSIARARTAHDEKMKMLGDERAEVKKLMDDLLFLQQHGWDINVRISPSSIMDAWRQEMERLSRQMHRTGVTP